MNVQRGRNRGCHVLAVLLAIELGLASRRFRGALPDLFGKYPGDALWALMIFFALGAILPKASTARIALFTLAVCATVELLKLYQAPWIVGIRYSTLGHLVFGQVFSWANLAAYAAGAVGGIFIERLYGLQKR